MKKNHIALVGHARYISATLRGVAHFATIALLAACSGDDGTAAEEPAQQTGQETEAAEYTVSIPATIGDTDSTRAVSLNDKTGGLDATFKTTDRIYVFNRSLNLWARKMGDNCVLQPDQEGSAANLTGKLAFNSGSSYTGSKASVGNKLLLLYNPNINPNSENPLFEYTSQKGTLENLGNFDFATANVTITDVSGSPLNYTVTTSQAQFNNLQSMFKLTFKGLLVGDEIRSLGIESANNKLCQVYDPIQPYRTTYNMIAFNLTDAARAANGEGIVYVALRFDGMGADQTDNITFYVSGTSGRNYIATKTSPKGGFLMGKYYRATVTFPTYVGMDASIEGWEEGDTEDWTIIM